MPRNYARRLRVAAELHQVLSELLRTEVKDPRLEDVRINAVELSGDLGVAKVYFGTLDPDADAGPAEAALKHAAGFLRTRMSRELRLRRAPELRFLHDEAARRGVRLTRLIEGVAGEDKAEGSSEPSNGE